MQHHHFFIRCLAISWIYLQLHLNVSALTTNTNPGTSSRTFKSKVKPFRTSTGKGRGRGACVHTHVQTHVHTRLCNDTRHEERKIKQSLTILGLANIERGGGNLNGNVNGVGKTKTLGLGLGFGLGLGKEIRNQYQQRVAADPEFLRKSIVEVLIAASTQLTAEVGRRGRNGILPEIDFVIAGLLTAIAGKYYSMWRVAKTASRDDDSGGDDDSDNSDKGDMGTDTNINVKNNQVDMSKSTSTSTSTWRSKVPTNAFQDTLLDGKTKPNITQRIAAFFVPMPSLFQAGFIASLIGYGFTSLLISLRSYLIPTYEAATASINILHACLYTGTFMALISNIRYQLLQGLVEPKIIERVFGKSPGVRNVMIVGVRLANGLLGSYLAITGMKLLGLQKLK
jgi:hypothetical protein